MKKLSLFFVVALMLCSQLLNAQDIFKQHGFTKEPLTLSNGNYNEFFNNDEIVQIGTVLLNTRTNQLAAFVDNNTAKAAYLSELSSRWLSPDPLAAKYPQFSPYVYCANNPILLKDPNGKDWIVSTREINGKTQINLTFVGAVMNSSGKQINMQQLMNNQVKQFQSVFGQGNVHATMMLREVKSKNDIKSHESLIDIKAGSNFGPKDGGNSHLGGKYVSLNADYIDKNGSFTDKKTMVHEVGHTGGLVHPWEFNQKQSFINGNPAPTNSQSYTNSSNSADVESNFMNYTSEAVKNLYSPFSTMNFTNYFNNTVGNATQGQEQQIINNLYNGDLNNDDIPEK